MLRMHVMATPPVQDVMRRNNLFPLTGSGVFPLTGIGATHVVPASDVNEQFGHCKLHMWIR